MSIQEHLNKIRNAIYGREVRESIAKGIETAYNDASEKHDNANMEVKLARGTHSNLNNRLKKMDEVDREVTAQLAQTETYIGDTRNALNNRIDNIITSPAGEGINKEEILDSRHGNLSLGSNILGVKQEVNNLSSNLMRTATNQVDNTDASQWFDGTPTGSGAITKQGSTLISTGDGKNKNVNIRQNLSQNLGEKLYYLKTRFLVEDESCHTVTISVGSQFLKNYRPDTATGTTAERFTVGEWKEVSLVFSSSDLDRINIVHRYNSNVEANGKVLKINPIVLIDMTHMFGKGNEWTAPAMRNLLLKNNRSTFEKHARLNPRRIERWGFIKDFGAVGDGITDDTKAIQRALDYGGVIIFTKGTYLVSGTLRIRDNTIMYCVADDVKFKLAREYSLSPFSWRQDYLDYYPIFVTPRGTKNVELHGIEIEGSETFQNHIQVGIAIETTENVLIKNCKVNNINYHPDQAPPRPSGQFRTGWNIAMFRSKNVEVANTEAFYGGYECLRIGDKCENVKIHHSKFGYGWRTVFQILKGSKNIEFSDNVVVQDDFDLYDTHAALTFHSAADEPIENIRILRNRIKAKLYVDNPSGPFAITSVNNYSRDFTFEDNEIESNGYLIGYNGGGTLELRRNKGKAENNGFAINNHGLRKLVIEDNDIETTNNAPFLINSGASEALKRVRIKDNDLKTLETSSVILFGGTAEVTSPVISGNIVDQGGNAVYLPSNVKSPLVVYNDFSGSSGYYIQDSNAVFENNLV